AEFRALREREERFLKMEWDDYAFYYHMMNRTKDVDPFHPPGGSYGAANSAPQDVSGQRPENSAMMMMLSAPLRGVEHRYGPPPPHFYEVTDALERRVLPPPTREGPLFDLLKARKTVRLFDLENPMDADELSAVLFYTFGCHGIAPLTE